MKRLLKISSTILLILIFASQSFAAVTLLNKAGNSPSQWSGLSTDAKPTTGNKGSSFYAEDTGISYVYGSSGWVVDKRRAQGTASNMASSIHSGTSKTTPMDADETGIWDSVTGTLQKLNWANLKATLKAYFDGIYAAFNGEYVVGYSSGCSTLAAAVATIGATPATLVVPAGASAAISADIVIPSTLEIYPLPGANITIAAGKKLTIGNLSKRTGRYQWVTDNSADDTKGLIWAAGAIDEDYPEWHGAKGDGSTDDTAAIQLAVNSFQTIGSGTIRFGARPYKLVSAGSGTLRLVKYGWTAGGVPASINFIGVDSSTLGMPSTRFYCHDIVGYVIDLSVDNVSTTGLTIKNIYFQGVNGTPNQGSPTSWAPDWLGVIKTGGIAKQTVNLTLDRVYARYTQNVNAAAFYLNGVVNAKVDNWDVQNFYRGFTFNVATTTSIGTGYCHYGKEGYYAVSSQVHFTDAIFESLNFVGGCVSSKLKFEATHFENISAAVWPYLTVASWNKSFGLTGTNENKLVVPATAAISTALSVVEFSSPEFFSLQRNPTIVTNGNFAADSDWTGMDGTNWTYGAGGATHQTGNTTAISQTLSVYQNTLYRVTVTVSGVTGGTLTPSIGAVGGTAIAANGTAVYCFIQTANAVGAPGNVTFALTPSSTFNGTIDDVLVETSRSWIYGFGGTASFSGTRLTLTNLEKSSVERVFEPDDGLSGPVFYDAFNCKGLLVSDARRLANGNAYFITATGNTKAPITVRDGQFTTGGIIGSQYTYPLGLSLPRNTTYEVSGEADWYIGDTQTNTINGYIWQCTTAGSPGVWIDGRRIEKINAQVNKTDATLAGIAAAYNLGAGLKYGFRAVFNCTLDVTGGGKYAMNSNGLTVTSINYRVTTLDASGVPVTSAIQTALGSAVDSQAGVTDDKVIIEGTMTVNAAGEKFQPNFAQITPSGTSSVLAGGTFSVWGMP